jgi:hypothetical protein
VFTMPQVAYISMFDIRDMGEAVHNCIQQPSKWGNGECTRCVCV